MHRQPGKIPIGISSCLLGEKVRYDGGHKKMPISPAPWPNMSGSFLSARKLPAVLAFPGHQSSCSRPTMAYAASALKIRTWTSPLP